MGNGFKNENKSLSLLPVQLHARVNEEMVFKKKHVPEPTSHVPVCVSTSCSVWVDTPRRTWSPSPATCLLLAHMCSSLLHGTHTHTHKYKKEKQKERNGMLWLVNRRLSKWRWGWHGRAVLYIVIIVSFPPGSHHTLALCFSWDKKSLPQFDRIQCCTNDGLIRVFLVFPWTNQKLYLFIYFY